MVKRSGEGATKLFLCALWFSGCSASTVAMLDMGGAPCKKHSDCPSAICKADKTCAAEVEVAYVNNRADGCPSDANRDGSKSRPFCEIQSAADKTKLEYISVAGSEQAYKAVALPSEQNPEVKSLTLVGPGRDAKPSALVSEEKKSSFLLLTTYSPMITVEGFQVVGTNDKNAIDCSGSIKFQLFDTGISMRAYPSLVNISGCPTTIDRCNFSSTGGGAVFVSGTTASITNSIFFDVQSEHRPIAFGSDSKVVFAFNSLRKNWYKFHFNDDYEPVLNCPSAGIHNSIFIENTHSIGKSQLPDGCAFTNVVTGAGDPLGIAKTPLFDDKIELKLAPGLAANSDCCIDKVTDVSNIPNTDHDYDDNPRPLGAGYDIGAYEVE